MTEEEFNNLKTGDFLEGETFDKTTYYGFFCKERTKKTSSHTKGLYASKGLYAFWERDLERAKQRWDEVQTCKKCAGSGDDRTCTTGHSFSHLATWINYETCFITTLKVSSADCICPMFPGGLIQHSGNCAYMQAKSGKCGKVT